MMRHCYAIVLFVIFIIAVTQVQAQEQKKRVAVLSLLYSNDTAIQKQAQAVLAGFNASVNAREYWSLSGLAFDIVSVDEKDLSADMGQTISSMVDADSDIFITLGPMTGAQLASARPVLQEKKLVAFSPVAVESEEHSWDPFVYFTHVDPRAEVLALVRYALTQLRVRRIGFMRLTGEAMGDAELAETVRFLRDLGYTLTGEFTLYGKGVEGEDESIFNDEFEKFAATLPRAVIVCGVPSNRTKKFLVRMLTDPRTQSAYLLGPSALLTTFVDAAANAVGEFGHVIVPGQLLVSGTYPTAKQTEFEAIRQFQVDMRMYINDYPDSAGYTDPDHFLKSDEDGDMMVAGWVAAELLGQALRNNAWSTNREELSASLFNQRRYAVHDLIIGDYGGSCSRAAQFQGATCLCNQGGRTVFLRHIDTDNRSVALPEGQFTYGRDVCYTFSYTLAAMVNGLVAMMSDSAPGNYTVDAMMTAGSMAAQLFPQDVRAFTVKLLATNVANATADLQGTVESQVTTFLVGPVVDSMPEELPTDMIAFVDPIFPEPRLNVFRPNLIRFAPTLEQELYVLSQLIGKESGARVSAAIRGRQASEIAELLRETLSTFSLSLSSWSALQDGDALSERLPTEGFVFVLGVQAGDVPVLAHHLERAPGVRLLVSFEDMATLYPLFVQHFVKDDVPLRVLFSTSFPHWADTQSTSTSLRLYHSVTDRQHRTPLGLWTFLTARAVYRALGDARDVSPSRLASEIFSRRVLNVDDMLYGPYANEESCRGDLDCLTNYGATTMSVWSFRRAIDPSQAPVVAHVTPAVVHIRTNSKGLSTGVVIAIVVTVCVALLLIIVVSFFLIRRFSDSRDNRNAPRKVEDPVTIIFTDIESSTYLWATCSEIMPDAVATHHRLIRSLIAKYKCYEVKTIGDSFMIACKDASAAVQLVGDLQRAFLQHDWKTNDIDDAYHAFEEEKAAEDEEYAPPTARLDAEVYRAYWNGLRVRAGVHTGLSDIRYDEVTKGYDYYGGTSNTAARTESVANGGQVLLTAAAYMALSAAERAAVAVTVTALGAVALRGVPEPVEMYQLDAVPGRTFAELRLDRELDFDDDLISSSGASHCSRDGPKGALEVYAVSILSGLFSPLVPNHRYKVITSTCAWWGVRVPKRGASVSLDTYCSELIDLLAVKVNSVVSTGQSIWGANSTPSPRGSSLGLPDVPWSESVLNRQRCLSREP